MRTEGFASRRSRWRSPPSTATSSSWTILTICCPGLTPVSTSAPSARSRTRATKSLTTLKLTSASSRASRISRSDSSRSASVMRALPRRRLRDVPGGARTGIRTWEDRYGGSGPARRRRQTAAHSRGGRGVRQRGATRRRATPRTPRGRTGPARRSPRPPREDDRHPSRSAAASATPPFALPSSFVSTMPVTPGLAAEGLGLDEPVLAGRRVQDEEHVPGLARQAPLDDPADLRQLVHQLLLVLEPPGGVDEDGVEPARLGRGHGVEGHRHRGPHPPAARRPALRAARPRSEAARSPLRGTCPPRPAPRVLPSPISRLASLAIVVVLPVPLTPTKRITDGASPSSNVPEPTRARRSRISVARRDARPRRFGRHRLGSARVPRPPARAWSSRRRRPRSAPPRPRPTSPRWPARRLRGSSAAARRARTARHAGPCRGLSRRARHRGRRRRIGRRSGGSGSGGSRRRRNTYAPTSTGTSASRSERTRLTAASVIVTP